MGREVRMVPANWQHPTDADTGRYVPLHESQDVTELQRKWDEARAKWEAGLRRDYGTDDGWKAREADERGTFEGWEGRRPCADDYMPNWPREERTHLMMYEDTSEGTPISPAFETPEELARWLADNGASSFGSMTATYEQWLAVARGGWAPSMVADDRGLRSGVEHAGDMAAGRKP